MPQWIEGVHYYVNEQGLVVLTEQFHLERGYCCSNGCKHCPFDYENVPEPKKSELLHSREASRESAPSRESGAGSREPDASV